MPFVSIQLNSNRPDQIVLFFDSIEATANKPEDIEVLLHVDLGDDVMMQAMEVEKERRRFTLRLLQTDLVKGYATLWKPLNPLFELTHPDAYFVINLSDEMLFKTKGWDDLIRPYVGYYPDDIFRLRASAYRFRNYTDNWECGFAPDSIAFYTRRWLELSGDWNPCLGPDSFQQCVAYYLFTSEPLSPDQYNRDIPLAELRFIGEGAGIGLTGRAFYQRLCINNRAWFVLMSHRMQQEAKRRAMRMKANIIAAAKGDASVAESKLRRRFAVVENTTQKTVAKLSYRLSWFKTTFKNIIRAPWVYYYAGGGECTRRRPRFGRLVMMATYLPFSGADMLVAIENWSLRYNQFRSDLRHPRNHYWHVTRDSIKKAAFKIRSEWRRLRVFTGTKSAVSNVPKNVSLNIALGMVAWATATRLYSLQLRVLHMLPISARKKIKLSPLGISAGGMKRSVKHKLQSIPNLRFIISGAKASHFSAALKNIFRLPLYALVRTVDLLIDATLFLTGKRIAIYNRKNEVISTLPAAPLVPEIDKMAEKIRHSLLAIEFHNGSSQQLSQLLDNIESTADDPSSIEVVAYMASTDQQAKPLEVRVRYLSSKNETDYSLAGVMETNSYFIARLNGDMRFADKGWDTKLKQYIGYYPDHIFRVRASKYRFRNYKNFWQCCVMPDQLTFYTRTWLTAQEDWAPSATADIFQQCVAFYLFTSDAFSHVQFHREIAAPFIKLSEGAGLQTNWRNWVSAISPSIQQNAKRRAIKLKAGIIILNQSLVNSKDPLTLFENPVVKKFIIRGENGKIFDELNYGLSRRKIRLKTLLIWPLLYYHSTVKKARTA